MTTSELHRRRRLAAEAYQDVQQFYARQMHVQDLPDVAGWVLTFTEDGTFWSNAMDAPLVGRDAIEAATVPSARDRAAAGVIRRHVVTTLAVEPREDGDLDARSYILVTETRPGESSQLYVSTLCEDVLTPAADGWLVRSRRVHLDKLLGSAAADGS